MPAENNRPESGHAALRNRVLNLAKDGQLTARVFFSAGRPFLCGQFLMHEWDYSFHYGSIIEKMAELRAVYNLNEYSTTAKPEGF